MHHPPFPRWQSRPRLDLGRTLGVLFCAAAWLAFLALALWLAGQ